MGTPMHGFGLDAPAGATPPSARFTPGQPALADGLMGGFTPSPGPAGACGQQRAQQASPWMPAAPAWHGAGADSPAQPTHAAFLGLPGAGGPQVPVVGAAKPAFAAWSAAAAAGRAEQAAGSQPMPAPAANGGGPGRSRSLKQPCGACGLAEAEHIWVPCAHKFCGGCHRPVACGTCGATATYVRMW